MDNVSFNFGAIRDTTLKLSAAEIIRENVSPTLNAFVEKVKTIPSLNKQSLIYKNIEGTKPFEKERLAERFINQNLRLLINENWDNILRTNRTLRKELLNDIHVCAKTNEALCENINVLIEATTNPNFTDFEKEHGAYEAVLAHLTRKPLAEGNTNSEKTDEPSLTGKAWEYVTKIAVSNFNERYEHLNEQEKKVFKALISELDEKKTFCEELKEQTIAKIDNKLKEEKEEKAITILNEFKSKINSITEITDKNVDSVILAYSELSSNLND